MILLIDNYDSFVHNLARYVNMLGLEYVVWRNDKITIDEVINLKPSAIIISPGPCSPKDAGICVELVKKLGKSTPILGVCLGHQAICEAYGGQTVYAAKPTHGKASMIEHGGSALFLNLPNPMSVGRYHSLIGDVSQADDLNITSVNQMGEVMSVQHKNFPVFGVQFHPESVLTPDGIEIIKNFIQQSK